MKQFFQKKFEVPSIVIILIIFTILVLTGNILAINANAQNPILMIPGAAGVAEQGPDISITWNVVYIDFSKDGNQFRVWSCANPEDGFYGDWIIEETYDGLLKDCMEHAYSLYP